MFYIPSSIRVNESILVKEEEKKLYVTTYSFSNHSKFLLSYANDVHFLSIDIPIFLSLQL